MSDVPERLIQAINNILEPYGEKFVPGGSAPPKASGYKGRSDACRFLGCSSSTLSRLVRAGAVHPIKLTGDGRNSKVVFSIAELEAYVATRRA